MAGTRQGVMIAVLLASWLAGSLALATTARADAVPLPTPGPVPREGKISPPAPVAQTAQPNGQQPNGQQPSAQPTPPASGPSTWLDRLFGGKQPPLPSSDPTAFDPTQRALINKISAYLTSVQTLTGNFVQIGPDGRRTTGDFYMLKPGKVRFEYDPPSPIDIIADGQSVAVRDRQLGTQDAYQLSQTPLRFLLADRIDLMRDTNVVGVTADDIYVSVMIEEKQALIGTSRLMMMFDSKDFRLKKWTVTDPQGFDTTIALSNLDSSKRPDPNLFKIDYTHYVQ